MSISDWPEHERPREKLLRQGASALSDAELLAIFLRTGIAGKTAVDIARECLQQFGGLRALLNAKQKDLCQQRGLGAAKYVQLQATLELGRRYLYETITKQKLLTNTADTHLYLLAQLRDRSQEVFSVIFLDAKHQIIRFEELFHGTVNQAIVHTREIVKRALELNASALIVAHNHPSGNYAPSQSDIHLTKEIKQALALLDIKLLDHIVVGDGKTSSLFDLGYL